MSKSVLIEIDSAKIIKEASSVDEKSRESLFLSLMYEASVELKNMYFREMWMDKIPFESLEKWLEWTKTEDQFKYLKLKVVFL